MAGNDPERAARLKAALRDNLRKRKLRERATAAPPPEDRTAPPAGAEGNAG